MACFSFCYKCADRLLAVLPEWFGIDKVQASVVVFGSILVALGMVFEMVSPSPKEAGSRPVNQFYFNFGTNQPLGSSVPEKMEAVPGAQDTATAGAQYSWRKVIALVLISVGTSIIGAGIILRIQNS